MDQGRARDLAVAAPRAGSTTPVWTWSADRTVGFWVRRFAHDVRVHRFDAESAAVGTVSDRFDVATDLAADGVSDVLSTVETERRVWAAISSTRGASRGEPSWPLIGDGARAFGRAADGGQPRGEVPVGVLVTRHPRARAGLSARRAQANAIEDAGRIRERVGPSRTPSGRLRPSTALQ
jgi:hypothetical protein